MDEGGKFWLACWSVLGATMGGIILVCNIYGHKADQEITKMIEAGASPIAATCAVKGTYQRPVCTIYATKNQ